MSKSNDFKSLLSVFQDATSSSPRRNAPSSGAAGRRSASAAAAARTAPLPTSPAHGAPGAPPVLDPASAEDPNFSAQRLRERVERMIRVREIRRSAAPNGGGGGDGAAGGDGRCGDETTRREFHVAVCATIVDEFPHEALWRRWMETGGGFRVDDGRRAATNGEGPTPETSDDGEGTRDGEGTVEPRLGGFVASAELHVHAKNPERVRSGWLRARTLPVSHRPNWNDVRIVRAVLSLLEAALRDGRTTHVLLCTESCIPVSTLKETARSVLLNEACHWREEGKGEEGGSFGAGKASGDRRRRLDWDRSYADCYGRDSGRCTRFDEHNCWDILRDSIPGEAIYKALPGWCFLSRKHARHILDLPSRLGGVNLWPAFVRVWAPEEVYIPTALSLCGLMDEVSRRALTHSRWDERAADHKDRAHPMTYDGCFGSDLVSRVRRDGSLFLRKMKRPLDVALWENIVVRRRRGQDSSGLATSDQGDWEREGRREGRGREGERHKHGNDHGERNDRSCRARTGYDSRRGGNYRRRNEDDYQWRKRGQRDHSNYDSSWKRHRWR